MTNVTFTYENIEQIINNETAWRKEHLDDVLDTDYQKGFIQGLSHAKETLSRLETAVQTSGDIEAKPDADAKTAVLLCLSILDDGIKNLDAKTDAMRYPESSHDEALRIKYASS